MGSDFLSESNLESAERLYGMEEREYQAACVGYMYGLGTKQEAERELDGLPEVKIAEAMDYFALRELPYKERSRLWEQKKDERIKVEQEYGLTPVKALLKREELLQQSEQEAFEEDFARSVEALRPSGESLGK